MFDQVYLGPHTRTQHEQARRSSVGSSNTCWRIRHASRGRGRACRAADYIAGMTDRFALTYARRSDGADQRRVGPRRRRRRRHDRGGFGAHAARKTGARYVGRCPFHEERTPSFSVNAQDKLFYCFGCGKGGDVIAFVRDTEQVDFAEAVEWLAERSASRSNTKKPRRSSSSHAAALRTALHSARPRGVVLRAASVGERSRGARAGVPRGAWPRRANLPRVSARALTRGPASPRTAERLHA